jgi:hypothetical protein
MTVAIVSHWPHTGSQNHIRPSQAFAVSLIGWYLLIPPVFSPMGEHHRSFNDLTAPLNKWDI